MERPDPYSVPQKYWVEIKPLEQDNGSSSVFWNEETGKYHSIYPVYGKGIDQPPGYEEILLVKKSLRGRAIALFVLPGHTADSPPVKHAA